MLNELQNPPGATNKNRKRVGRGPGSTLGKTSGRGHKGANSRSGSKRRIGFEGGQMPIHRRLPKRGFKNIFRQKYSIVNIADIEKNQKLDKSKPIDVDAMLDSGLVRNEKHPVKILGNGSLSEPVTVEAHKFSASAEKKITDAGGKPVAILK